MGYTLPIEPCGDGSWMDADGTYLDSKDVEDVLNHYDDVCLENALLKKKLEIALRGLDEYGDEKNWSHVDGLRTVQLKLTKF